MKLSLAEYELMAIWQDAHGRRTTNKEELEKIYGTVMDIAERAVEARRDRNE